MRLPRTALLFLAAAAARAADPAPAQQDSIATAKSDLAIIKAPQAQADLTQSLPGLDSKDSGPPAATLPSAASLLGGDDGQGAGALKKPKEGTGNWLVDAMDKSDPNRAKAKGGDDLLKLDSGAELSLLDQAKEKTHEAEPAKAPAFNPLDSFMSGWISAKDQEVLLPVSKGEIAGSEAPKAHTDALQNLDLAPGSVAAELLPAGTEAPQTAESKALTNPYLAAVDVTPATQVKGFTAPELPAISTADALDTLHAPAAPELDTKAPDLTRSFIPDFAQPGDDDKFLKEMKHF